MSTTCAVSECTSQPTDDSIEFFQFPDSEVNRLKWSQFCGITMLDSKTTNDYICSRHFDESAYISEIKQFGALTCLIRSLHPDAVPTLFPSLNKSENNQNSPKLQIEATSTHQFCTNALTDPSDLKMENNILDKQIKKLNAPKVNINVEPPDSQKYSHIKTPEDLLRLRIDNQILQRRIKLCEAELAAQKRCLKQKEQSLILTQSEMSYKRLLTKTVLSKIFSERQLKIISSNRKTRWTEDDFAVGLTIRHLSNRSFYEYLTNTLNYPLPSPSSIRRHITLKKRKVIRKTKPEIN